MTNKLVDGGNIVVSAGYNEAVNGYPLNSVFGYRYVGKEQNQDQLDYYVDKYVGSNSIALPANLRLGDHMYEDVNKDDKLTQDDLYFSVPTTPNIRSRLISDASGKDSISIPYSKVWASVPSIVKSTLGKCLSRLFG